MTHPLDSARERLKRADTHIDNLNKEVIEFLRPFPTLEICRVFDYGKEEVAFSDDERAVMKELQDGLKRSVPPDFSVIAGEIIHHLRSAFDHLAWQLSSTVSRGDKRIAPKIEFPVLDVAPTHTSGCRVNLNKSCRYCQKTYGITIPSALARIEDLQPYKRRDLEKYPLWNIHDLDRLDKHRGLIVIPYSLQTKTQGFVMVPGWAEQHPYELTPRRIFPDVGQPKMELRLKITAEVTLAEIG